MKKWTIIAILILLTVYFYESFDSGRAKEFSSINFSSGRFHNLTEHPRERSAIFSKVFKILFLSDRYAPKTNPPAVKLSPEYLGSYTHGHLQAVWAGHSTVLLKYNDMKVIIDPVFSDRVSPVSFAGPKRLEKFSPLDGAQTGYVDAVIISHDHYDHLDKKAVEQLKDRVKMFIVPLGVGKYLKDWGVDPLRIVELDWGQSLSMRDLRIISEPASHMSGRSIFSRNTTLWSSFVINIGPYRVYYTGDTGYINDFKNIGYNFGPFDLVLADIGAYNPAWQYNHMTPEHALKAMKDLNGRIIMPVHWGTFILTDVNWKEPIERFTKAAKKDGIRYAVPIQGEPVDISEPLPEDDWWSSVK